MQTLLVIFAGSPAPVYVYPLVQRLPAEHLALLHVWEVPKQQGGYCIDSTLPSHSPQAPRSSFCSLGLAMPPALIVP